jgi:hypothetical protein
MANLVPQKPKQTTAADRTQDFGTNRKTYSSPQEAVANKYTRNTSTQGLMSEKPGVKAGIIGKTKPPKKTTY